VLFEKHVPECDALYRIAAHLPQTGLPYFSKAILEHLPDTGNNQQSSDFLQCLFSWGEEYRAKVRPPTNQFPNEPKEKRGKDCRRIPHSISLSLKILMTGVP